ncbi:MAG: cytochrome c maturation protein CcmE [Proteobacteria bacterium]|nr:cytochrome c maturation protein CcmE [Pseudomonadota bacterium]
MMSINGSRRRTLVLMLVSGGVISAAVLFLVFSSVSGGSALEYFKNVDEVTVQPQRWLGRRLRVHGNVVAGTIQKKPGTLDHRFAVHSRGQWLEVSYRGLVPDTFKDCAEVVVKGQLLPSGRFAADTVTAKCPSKYDEKQRLSGCGDEVKPQVLSRRSVGRT